MIDQRSPRFIERFSKWMATLAAMGCGWILAEPRFVFVALDGALSFTIGGTPFSDEVRGGVVITAIVGTIIALQKEWLPGRGQADIGTITRAPPIPTQPSQGEPDASAKPQ